MSASTRDRRRTAHRLTDRVHWTALRAKVQPTHRDIDALLLPTTTFPALLVETVDASLEVYTEYNLQYLRNTSIGNVLNLCGLSEPCGFTSQGLPIGLTIYDNPFQEDLMLRIGYTSEQATDWHRYTPDLSWVHG